MVFDQCSRAIAISEGRRTGNGLHIWLFYKDIKTIIMRLHERSLGKDVLSFLRMYVRRPDVT